LGMSRTDVEMSTVTTVGATNDTKKVFEEITELARQHKAEFRFEQADRNGMIRKYFYFGDKLVGVGDD